MDSQSPDVLLTRGEDRGMTQQVDCLSKQQMLSNVEMEQKQQQSSESQEQQQHRHHRHRLHMHRSHFYLNHRDSDHEPSSTLGNATTTTMIAPRLNNWQEKYLRNQLKEYEELEGKNSGSLSSSSVTSGVWEDDRHKIILYAWNLFGIKGSEPEILDSEFAEIAASRFNCVVLWTLHVEENGDLKYNDVTLCRKGKVCSEFSHSDLPERVEYLRKEMGKQILFSIGSACVKDFYNIKNLLSDNSSSGSSSVKGGREVLLANLRALSNFVHFDGFDLDLEEFDQDYVGVIVDLTMILAYELNSVANNTKNNNSSRRRLWHQTPEGVKVAAPLRPALGAPNKIVTFCPYKLPEMWGNCLQQIWERVSFEGGTEHPVKWMNLQCYAGGQRNHPTTWLNMVRDINEKCDRRILGDVPEDFIVPGYWTLPEGNLDTDGLAQVFMYLGRQGFTGGFVWCTKDIFSYRYPPNRKVYEQIRMNAGSFVEPLDDSGYDENLTSDEAAYHNYNLDLKHSRSPCLPIRSQSDPSSKKLFRNLAGRSFTVQNAGGSVVSSNNKLTDFGGNGCNMVDGAAEEEEEAWMAACIGELGRPLVGAYAEALVMGLSGGTEKGVLVRQVSGSLQLHRKYIPMFLILRYYFHIKFVMKSVISRVTSGYLS